MNVLFFSEMKWNFVTMRKKHLLKRFPQNCKILFIEPFKIGFFNHFIPKKEKNIYYISIPMFQGYTRLKFIKFLLNFKFIRTFLEFLSFSLIKIFLFILKMKHPMVFTSNIYYANLLKKFNSKEIYFDCNDDFLAFNTSLWAKEYFKKTIKESKIVFASSEILQEKIYNIEKKKIYLIKNGVDIIHFNRKRFFFLPKDLEKISQPIIGYMGIISYWFDFNLIKKIALEFRKEKIVLIGPIAKEVKKEVKKFKVFDNIIFLGKKAYKDLPAYINLFKVGIVPFKKTNLTLAMNYSKIYIYLSMGIPVVSIFNLSFFQYQNDIFLANNSFEFIEGIKKALKGEYNKNKLIKIARENSWDERAKKMMEVIKIDGNI